MKLEFELRSRDVAFLSTFEPAGKIRRAQGRYYLALDSDDPEDRRQWARFFERDEILLDGHSPKQLAAFDAGFAEPECKKILEDLARARKGLPALVEECDVKAAEAAIMQVCLSENTDLSRTEVLFAELKRKQNGAELAEARVKTSERRIGELEKMLRDSISRRKQAEAEKLKAQLAPAAERFNKEIEEAYSRFWSVAGELLPRIAERESGFPPQIHFGSPVVNVGDGARLKSLRAIPQILMRPDRLQFSLQETAK